MKAPRGSCWDKMQTRLLTRRITRNLLGRCRIKRGSKLVVGVSGGLDSVALLHLLLRVRASLRLEVSVAHFNHRLRGRQSTRDELFVRDLAARLEVPCHVGSGDVKGMAETRGLCLQEAARMARYDFFRQVLAKTRSSHLLTAHTMDDQAEELLLRIVRGAGLAGLSGIPWTRDGWIARPLLDTSKKELADFMGRHGLSFVEDGSNASDKYLRNKVRHRLIPLLSREFNPSIVKTLAGSARILSEEHRFLEELAEEALSSVLLDAGYRAPHPCLDAERLALLDRALRRRVIRLYLGRIGLHMGRTGSRHILAIDSLLERGAAGWETRLPGGWSAKRLGQRLCFSRAPARPGTRRESGIPGKAVVVEKTGTWPAPSGLGTVEIQLVKGTTIEAIRRSSPFPRPIFLDPAKVTFPMELRLRRPGDRFWPLGGRCPCKLKDFLISRKVSREMRDHLPLLVAGGEVAAVLGVEVGHPFRVSRPEEGVLEVTWRYDPSPITYHP